MKSALYLIYAAEREGVLQEDLDAFNCCLASVKQLRHEPWACEGTFICNLSPTQKGSCSCGSKCRLNSCICTVSQISVPGQTLLQDSNLSGCLSPNKSILWALSSVFGVRAHSHVWERSAGQGICLVSKPHHTSGKIPQRERKNHQTDWTGTYWPSAGELGLGVQNPHSIILSVLH